MIHIHRAKVAAEDTSLIANKPGKEEEWHLEATHKQQEILIMLTRALLGLWIFHRLLGGGAFERPPPPWSRLLVAVEKNESQRSKSHEKSFRNHFGHFLSQVKIEASKGPN